MEDADGIMLEAVLDDVLDVDMIGEAIDDALRLVIGASADDNSARQREVGGTARQDGRFWERPIASARTY